MLLVFMDIFLLRIRSLKVYEKITQKLCDLSKKHIANTLEYIDVGGGFYGNVPKIMNINNVQSFDDYAETICSIMNKEKGHFKNEPIFNNRARFIVSGGYYSSFIAK